MSNTDDETGDDIGSRSSVSIDSKLTAGGICGMDDDHPPVIPPSTAVLEEVHDRTYDFDDEGSAPSITHK